MLISNFIVSAQTMDTLYLDVEDRDPTYFYGCWIDEDYAPGVKLEYYVSDNVYPTICAAPFYTKDSLKVIGIAGATEIKSYMPEKPDDTLAEYFQLYEATDTSFVKVAEARWDTISRVNKCIELIFHNQHGSGNFRYTCAPMYEAYFDSAITVYDSFYLAFTLYNNGLWLEPNSFGQMVYMHKPTRVVVYTIDIPMPVSSQFIPCMPHSKTKFLPVEGDYYANRYFMNSLIDTNIWYTMANNSSYLPMFPIFDTTRYHVDTCADVSNFAVVSTDSVSALLSWDSTSRSIGWELAYGPQGTAPDNATVLEMSSTVHRLSGLDSGAWYVAYVRAKCGEEEYSNWSSGVEFYIAGDTTSRELSIHTSLLEQYTYLMPNPAHDVVSVFSSFSMNRLEVYSMNGVLMERMDCEGLSTQLTVSGYPRGAYIVKVYTPKGVATKKLVVK